MKRVLLLVVALLIVATRSVDVCAESETIDLKALTKKVRAAVILLVVSDATGKETGTGFIVSSDGKLTTNHRVIEDGASAVAKAGNGGLFPIAGGLADAPKNELVELLQ